ncbi:MAG: hypothetical protein ACYSSO_12110 [Planctomycetota bacterium]|jgi:hypothetical protein
MGRKSFSFSEVLGFGWHVMKDNFGFFVGVALVLFLISLPGQILNTVVENYPEKIPLSLVFISLPLMLIIEIVVGIGLIKITLAFCDGQRPKFGTLFNAQDCFWRYIGTGLLYCLIIMGAFIGGVLLPQLLSVTTYIPYSGLLVFLIVGIITAILSIKFSLCFYFAIDKKLGPIKALRASSQTTMGVKWSLFVFGILCGLINFLGALCFVIGLFATFPTIMVAMALVYRQLSAQTPELVELGIRSPDAQFAPEVPSAPGTEPERDIPPGLSIRLGSPSVPSARFDNRISSAPNIQPETVRKKSHSLLPAVILGVVVISAITTYYLWPATKGTAATPTKQMQVTAILYSEDNPSAIVNGELVKEGDLINDVKVVKIHKNNVEFENNGQRWTQEAQPAPVKQ